MKLRSVAFLVVALWLHGAVSPAQDLRGLELLRLDCETAGIHSDVTLFANGMVRLREERPSGRSMQLLRLEAEELAGYRRRIASEDLSETDHDPMRVQGLVAESCRLKVLQYGQEGAAEPQIFHFAGLSSLSLPLSHLVALVRELEERVRQESVSSNLPPGYQPKPGDVLRRRNGALFRVDGFTSDGRGVELVGVEQPVTLYVAIESLSGEFTDVVSRATD